MKRSIAYLVLPLLCVSGGLAQSKPKTRALPKAQPGYYFTVGLCHACAYFGWHEDAIKGFRVKGIHAAVGQGYIPYANRTSNEPFAPIRAFKWARSEEFWSVELLVGPFGSPEAASRALDNFPLALLLVQRKRNKMDGSSGGWPISPSERVSHSSGNNYSYGFFDITAYRLLR